MSDIDLTSRRDVSAKDPTKPLEPDSSLGELFSRLTTDFTGLVSTQVELAKVEIKEEATQAARGAGLLTGGAFAGYLAITLLSFAAALGLDEIMDTAVAFLLVGLAWSLAAAVLYLTGRKELQAVRMPPQSKAAIKEDVLWAKQQKN
jgi:uncharacterized membrane protein YqjE